MITWVIVLIAVTGMLTMVSIWQLNKTYRLLTNRIKSGAGDQELIDIRNTVMWTRMFLIKITMACMLSGMLALAIQLNPLNG